SGNWSITTSVLSTGAHSLTIKATDAAGNVSLSSTVFEIRIETIAPSTPAPSTPSSTTNSITLTVDVKQGDTNNTVSQITIVRNTDTEGNASDTVTYEQKKALETINQLKKEGNDVARLVIPDTNDKVFETTVNIPTDSLEVIAEGDINLQIDTEDAKIDITKESLQSVSDSMNQNLYFNLIPIKENEKKEVLTERALFEVGVLSGDTQKSLSIIGTPMTIETNMPSTDVDITLPLTGITIPSDSTEREVLFKQLSVYIEHSDGTKELIQGEIVEYKDGMLGIKFHITKFSLFTLIKTDNPNKSANCEITKVNTPAKAAISENKITATVSNKTTSLTIKVSVSDKATWKLYSNKACTKEIIDNTMKLKVESNKAYIKVIAEDGTVKTYTLTIIRKKSVDCDITKMNMSSKAIISGQKITTTVVNTTTSSTVKVSVSDKASWKLFSDKLCKKELTNHKLKLKVGVNNFYIKVTAEDGTTSKVYTLSITRQEVPKKVIIVATKYDFTDAFAGGVLAGQLGGNVICTGISEKDAKKMVSYIKKHYSKQDEIYIIGLGHAVNVNLEKMLKKEGYTNIANIGGEDKYETAKLIADIIQLPDESKVVLVSGDAIPKDAQNIQKICAELGYPILFVETDNLTTYTIEALIKINPTQIYIVGDKTKISTKVVEEIVKEIGLDKSDIIRISKGKEIK
ncbi:MAG: cadherin-like beta sandwich domain-containing protein, partial [Herbinix sp.]|nr:cadherin-like beta sandwich domain-containing protein [Herbinix sp.]